MNNYLNNNLLPLMDGIKTKNTDSDILISLGLESRGSTQSFVIQFGNRIEIFWNKVFSDFAVNHVEVSDRIEVKGQERQIDHLFSTPEGDFYLECKCNLNFDSEKSKASNRKVGEVLESINKTFDLKATGSYFVPVVDVIPNSNRVKYNNKGLAVLGVTDIFNILPELPFTKDEYFSFLKNEVGSLLVNKGL